MNVYIVYTSIHYGNTERIAKEIGRELNAETVPIKGAKIDRVLESDLVGFGSGVYFSRFHRNLLRLVRDLPQVNGKQAFIFSTSGLKKMPLMNGAHRHFKTMLESKGFSVTDEFDCRGFDTYGPLKILGGINRGRPNMDDIKDAADFAKRVRERVT